MTRLLLVDDNPVVLRGLSSLIASDDGLEVIGLARTVAEAIALAVALVRRSRNRWVPCTGWLQAIAST